MPIVNVNPYTKLARGDVLPGLPAHPWNDMLDVVRDWKRGRLDFLEAAEQYRSSAGIVSVRNDTGAALARFSIVGCDTVIIKPTDNQQQFKNRATLVGTAPSGVWNQSVAIMQAPCRGGGIADGLLFGLTAVQVNVTSTAHWFAKPIVNTPGNLLSNPTGGFPILWKDPAAAAGVQWCYVLIGRQETPPFLAQAATFTATVGAVTVTPYIGGGGSAVPSLPTVSAYLGRGALFAGVPYQVQPRFGGLEISNPSMQVRGLPGVDVAADASGSMIVYAGNGAGVSTGVLIAGIRNDSSCLVKSGKLAYAAWQDDLGSWVFDVFHVS